MKKNEIFLKENEYFRSQIYRLVDCFYRQGSRVPFQWGAWIPAVDVYETEDKIVVLVDIAGVSKENIDLTFQENKLLIRGTRPVRSYSNPEIYYQMEINFGPFERIIQLPCPVDAERAEAVYKEGFLEIVLPKK